jgi:type I restriction enzyme M protein
MLTGEIKNQIDRIWDAFWSGGISNPLEVIEQITYLLFLRRLDDLQTLEENRANTLKTKVERRVFPEGKDPKKRPYSDLRWSKFKNFSPADMFTVLSDHAFPFLRTLGGDDSTYAHHMKDARFTIPTPALLAKVVDRLDQVPMEDRDTKGDLYEYMLGKIASAGQNGQFRTPRHIIQLMVEMMAPGPKDVICDPACGTAGFLVAAGEYLRVHHPSVLRDAKQKEAFSRECVPRLRFRQHHAPDRQHEHAPARRGESRHPLPRLAGAGSRWRGGEIQRRPGQPAVRRVARLREHGEGSAADRQDQED